MVRHGLTGDENNVLIVHPGPLEVGYSALSSGFEKPFVEALQMLGINLAPEPVLCPYTFAALREIFN